MHTTLQMTFLVGCAALFAFGAAAVPAPPCSEVPLADPNILLDGGVYYAYGTYDPDGIRCYTSTNLTHWSYSGLALHKKDTSEKQNFWAPEVYRLGSGKYLMYYSANLHLYAALAERPAGPFRQVGGSLMAPLLGDALCIDSHLALAPNGTPYLFFVRLKDGNHIWQVQLAEDRLTPVSGTLRHCLSATEPWEIVQGRIAEGPFVLQIGSRFFLTYSANDCRSPDYALGFALSDDLGRGVWTKSPRNPFMHKWAGLTGTGHHSFFTDAEGRLRIVFHAHNSATTMQPRCMYIGTMIGEGDTLRLQPDSLIVPKLEAP